MTWLQRGYFFLLLGFHAYYAIWVRLCRNNPAKRANLYQVRHETFVPVLIISFAFFFAVTHVSERISASLYAIPIALFSFYVFIHFRHQRRGSFPAKSFARWTTAFLLASPAVVFGIGWALGAPIATAWAKALLVALALGLYLSLFELWRLTNLFDVPDPAFGARRQRYYQATLVSHGVSLVALPLMFVFGNFGWIFLLAAELHAIAALTVWYRAERRGESGTRWVLFKLAFAFGFLAIIVADVASGSTASLMDRYPRELTGLSASLFVAVLLAVLASPVVQYLTAEDSRPRPIRALIADFFSLPAKWMVFRLAAVLSGILFIVMDFIYEGAWILDRPTAAKASYAFWMYAVATVVFSVMAFFAEKPPTATAGGNRERGIATTALGALVGALQTLRVVTGGIIFLGVIAVGFSAGASPRMAGGLALAAALVAMGSFGINDYYDYAKDAVNARHRAIPSGRLTPRGALACGLGALICGVVVGMRVLDGVGFGVFLVGCFGGAIYNELVRVAPAWKGTITAFLSALVIVLDLVAFQLSVQFLWVSLSCLLFVVGRELLMDVRDIAGDRLIGTRTLAVRLGARLSERLGFLIIAISFLPLVGFSAMAGLSFAAYVVLGTSCAAGGIAALIWFLGAGSRRYWLAVEVLKVPILAGIALMVIQ